MADEWLRADQVADLALRLEQHNPCPSIRDIVGKLVTSHETLRVAHYDLDAVSRAQDGRGRALVGALLAALPRDVVQTIYDTPTGCQHLLAIYDAAQAALAGTPPPTREPSA